MKHDVAVVIISVCRESLIRAVHSVYKQSYSGRIQILVGIDCDPDKKSALLHKELREACPPHINLIWLDLGYSTSKRHGGVHDCFFGGSLRSALTLLANAEIVVYLDDDDWFHTDHLIQIMTAINGKKWAFAYSIYADGNTGQGVCVDEIESVGVNKGIFKEKFGGFVRPSGLAIDKMKLLPLVHLWSCSPFPTGDGEDRLIFDRLRSEEHGCTGNATVLCALDPKDGMHPTRLAYMQSKGVIFTATTKVGSSR